MSARTASKGAALVLVMWLIALLTVVVAGYAMAARVESLQERVLADDGVGQEHARAGLEYALARLQEDGVDAQRWVPDDRVYTWQYDDVRLQIRIHDEAAKVNLNTADALLLAGLVQALGEEKGRAEQLAGAIIDWRDRDDLRQAVGGAETADYVAAGLPYPARNAPFDSVEELQRVLGMDARLQRLLAPHLTVHGRRARPDARFASAPVLTALGMDAELVLQQREVDTASAAAGTPTPRGSGLYSIDSRAIAPDGRESVLRAIVRTGNTGRSTMAYAVLQWQQGMTAR